eukprot:COSAG06_NODE_870_length_11857_cov_5.075693_2_plen_181_part_00
MCFQLLCNAISHRSSSRESSRWAAVYSRCSCRSYHLDTCWYWRPNSHPRNRRQAVVRETCCAAASSQGHRQCLRKNALFLNFSYVCPEPVLAKCSFLNRNGSQKAISARFPHRGSRHIGFVQGRLCRPSDGLSRSWRLACGRTHPAGWQCDNAHSHTRIRGPGAQLRRQICWFALAPLYY